MWRVLLVALCLPWLSFAKPTKQEMLRAEKLSQQGKTAYNQTQNYEEALRLFEEAYRLWPSTKLLINIGQCHRKLSQYREALPYFEQALAQSKDPKEQAQLREVIADILQRQKSEAPSTAPSSEPATTPASAPTTIPASAPASLPEQQPERLEELTPAMFTAPLFDAPRSRLGEASYLAAGASLSFGAFAGAMAFKQGLALASDLTPGDDARQQQRRWALTSDLSMSAALVAGGVGYWKLRTKRAPAALWAISLVGLGLGVGSGYESLKDAKQEGALRDQPDADPIVLRPLDAKREAYGRASTVMLSLSLSTGALGTWLYTKQKPNNR